MGDKSRCVFLFLFLSLSHVYINVNLITYRISVDMDRPSMSTCLISHVIPFPCWWIRKSRDKRHKKSGSEIPKPTSRSGTQTGANKDQPTRAGSGHSDIDANACISDRERGRSPWRGFTAAAGNSNIPNMNPSAPPGAAIDNSRRPRSICICPSLQLLTQLTLNNFVAFQIANRPEPRFVRSTNTDTSRRTKKKTNNNRQGVWFCRLHGVEARHLLDS